ncbi:MAG: hypothetical protein IJP48_11235 [Synergistaceae bacterium]|nr:hypothetical protein [Synergistaceae bacterium]
MKKFLCALLLLVIIACPSFAMTYEQKNWCHAIIHTATVSAIGSAALLAQAPGADNIPLAVCIGGMTIALAEVFDIPLLQMSAETIGIGVIGGVGTAYIARIVTQWVVGWIPWLGNAVNAATMAGLVEYIGWKVAGAFDQNGWAITKVIVYISKGYLIVNNATKLLDYIFSGKVIELVEALLKGGKELGDILKDAGLALAN